MKLIVDENLHFDSISLLIAHKFDVLHIGDIVKWGAIDEEIYLHACRHQIPIITHDRRFGNLYYTVSENSPLTIILQVLSPHPQKTNKLLGRTLNQINLKSKEYSNKLIIINQNKIRIRSK